MTRIALHVLLLAVLTLAGCSSASMRRDLDVTGSLPRLIGLGGFAPNCLVLCFVSSETKQGNIVYEDLDPESLTVHRTETDEFKPKARLSRKAKPLIAPKSRSPQP